MFHPHGEDLRTDSEKWQKIAIELSNAESIAAKVKNCPGVRFGMSPSMNFFACFARKCLLQIERCR